MPIVNLTDEQYAELVQPKSLIEQVIAQPWVWLVIALVLIIIIIWLWKSKSNKEDPSVKQWFGRNLRKDLMKKEYKKRFDVMGKKVKRARIEKGITRMGVVDSIEYDKVLFEKRIVNPATRKYEWKPDFWYRVDRIKFRKHGFASWLKSLFGLGYEYIVLTPDSYKQWRENRGKNIVFQIDPTVHLINDSDIWTVSDQRTIKSNDEFVFKANLEDVHGNQLDMTRRIAILSANTSAKLEQLSHESDLKEKERKSRIQPYT